MYDIAVIGLGVAGLEVVKIALENNLNVIAFESDAVGGTCLNKGCIPTKSILHDAFLYSKISRINSKSEVLSLENLKFNWNSILKRKDETIEKFCKPIRASLSSKNVLISAEAKIYINNGKAEIHADNKIYSARKIIIASGSKPYELSELPFDGKFILNSDDMFHLKELPKSVAIIGSGAIGLEWADILASLGVQVKIIEKAKSVLPLMDTDIQKRAEILLKHKGIEIFKDDFVINYDKNTLVLNSKKTINVDCVLSAVGRIPKLPKVYKNNLNQEVTLKIYDGYKTDFDNIYITGDASGGIMLAHNASNQAKQLMNLILYGDKISKKSIPSVVYTSFEIAGVGLREQDISDKTNYIIKKIPVAVIAKAWCDNETDGFVKVIIKDDLILGAHIISKEADSLISLFSVFIDLKIPISSVKNLIFPHPSFAELISEVLK